jgi:hypothetical protein
MTARAAYELFESDGVGAPVGKSRREDARAGRSAGFSFPGLVSEHRAVGECADRRFSSRCTDDTEGV